MVPDIEELRAEFKMHLLAHRKLLDEGNIPVLQARTANGVSTSISKGPELSVGNKRAGIKQGARNTMRTVWIPDHIRTRTVEDGSAAIGVGNVHEIVGSGKPIPGLSGNDSGNLPVPHDLVPEPDRSPPNR